MKQKREIRFPIWVEIILVIALVAASAGIRFYLLARGGCDIQGGMSFFESAQVGGNALPPLTWQNLSVSEVYTQLLHLVLSFLGNRQEAALWFQNAMFLLWMLVFYFVIRIAVGRILAIPFLAVAALLPTIVFGESHIRVLTPGVLVWTAIGIVLLILAVVYRVAGPAIRRGKEQNSRKQIKEDDKASQTISDQKPRKRTDPIPNPLPGPKKHVKRELDFEIECNAYQLDFDHQVSENDDFDL